MRYRNLLTGISLLTMCVIITSPHLRAQNAPPADYQSLKAEAEKAITDGSYARANSLYKQAVTLDLPANEKRWVAFRIADTSWRSQAGTQTSDSTIYDNARKQLEDELRPIEREENRDATWAMTQESLADFYWNRRDSQNWGEAWPHYQLALDFWAGASQLDIARANYLRIVWTMSQPSWIERNYYNLGTYVSINILDNALSIAKSENDKAHAHYLIALTLRNQGGDWAQRLRIPREFEGAIAIGKQADWYDDALYAYGEWMHNNGPVRRLANGQWTAEPDYPAALAIFQRLLREFNKGETRYYDQAKNQIDNITRPVVGVSVSNIFLPKSEIQFQLQWRNVKSIDLNLFLIDMTRDVRIHTTDGNLGNWLEDVDLAAAEKIKSWAKDTEDKGDYKPGQSSERLDQPLEPGAYVLEASGGGKKVREIVLVTDSAVVLKSAGSRALAFACNAVNSAPMANTTVRVWRMSHDNNRWSVHDAIKTTNNDGLCVFDANDFGGDKDVQSIQYFAATKSGDRQAFSWCYSQWHQPGHELWKIYAFTDRPAYRPGDTVQWKLIARSHSNQGYQTPANQKLEYEINDPRGQKIKEGSAALNAFGSAWVSVEVTEQMPLGEYHVTYWLDKAHQQTVGSATLFRLEEYKLPEFQVTVRTPEDKDGRRKAFRLGDTVEVNIQADYYFGGPVANASVEVVVQQNPHYHWWRPPHDFPWCYEDPNPYRYWGGQGQVVKRETIKTNAEGKAMLTFATPADSQQDLEYRIEARVTDASRREITGSDTVRVTRQRYYVYPNSKHNIHRPQDRIEIDFKALDANEQPVQTDGIVKVTREVWREVWIDPAGAEVSGARLLQIQSEMDVFPPPPTNPIGPFWRLKSRAYESEVISTSTVKLDAKGEATYTFIAPREGYFRISWMSEDIIQGDLPSVPITAETSVWVCTNATSELGYRHGGVEIIIDKDTFRVGHNAPAMIVTPTNDRYVLFTVEGNDLYSYQVVHVTGTVKLVEVPIDQRHVPNVYLSAAMAHDAQLHMDTKEVIVPPVEQYYDVTVIADRSQYQPGEEGMFNISVKDHDGKPAQAELALAVSDEAVSYIQQDLSGDPRKFFFDQRQSQVVQINSTFQQRSYIRLVKGEKDELIDSRLSALMKERELRDKDESGVVSIDDLVQGNFDLAGSGGRGDMAMRKSAGRSAGSIFGDSISAPGAPSAAAEGQIMDGLNKRLGMDAKSLRSELKIAGQAVGGGGRVGEEPAVVVRSDFRATLFWQPDIVTDEDGTAHVKLKYSDSLTSWKALARVAGKGQQFGISSVITRTKMPLIARLQAPRFFLVGDVLTISGVFNNNTEEQQTVRPELVADGLTILGVLVDGKDTSSIKPIEVAANGESRIDWQIKVEKPGEAKVNLTARSDKYADAMEKTYPVYEHGVERFIAKSGKVRGDDVTIQLEIPSERKPESTTLTVQITPSMAVTMLDALPYLIDYPYGCTEQTMSRFLPAAITAKTLQDLGLNPEDAMNKVFGGIEHAHVAKTQPKGKKNLDQLQQMVNAGLDRLYGFQHNDGGWGWWKDGESDHFMTAYVLWGLALAHQANLDVKIDVMDRAAQFLDMEIVEEETAPDMQAWLLHALAVYDASLKHESTEFQRKAMENLWTQRDKLNAYTRALLALAAHHLGDAAKAKTLVENLENGVKRDNRPDTSVIIKGVQGPNDAVIGTAHWGEDGLWWRWSDGGVEATAFALRAMLAIDPKNALIEPVTNWLIKNRRGAQWSNTRDTAIVVLAMNDYLRISGELKPEMEYALQVNGHDIASKKITSADIFAAPSRFEIDRQFIRDGNNDIRIVRKSGAGNGPIYFAADAQFFSLEEPVPPAGNEIFVRREYYKLVPRPTLLKGVVYDRQPLPDGQSVTSGERVEVVLTIESKNNYDYLVFEDLKPAGLEAVAIRSGESLYTQEMKTGAVQRAFGKGEKSIEDVTREQAHGDRADYTGRTRWVYQELRDRKVAMFIDHLPEGVWELRYDLRAEVPGQFHALPVMGHAMYVPEIRCNGAEIRINVTDRLE